MGTCMKGRKKWHTLNRNKIRTSPSSSFPWFTLNKCQQEFNEESQGQNVCAVQRHCQGSGSLNGHWLKINQISKMLNYNLWAKFLPLHHFLPLVNFLKHFGSEQEAKEPSNCSLASDGKIWRVGDAKKVVKVEKFTTRRKVTGKGAGMNGWYSSSFHCRWRRQEVPGFGN